MGTISTFGSFTQARLAIYASHKGLSVTGNNISNINTTGYTRQRLEQRSFYASGAERYYSTTDVKVGNGVLPTGVSQLRDPYLDIRYRSQMANVGAMDAKLAGLEGIQAILDEVSDGEDGFGIISARLDELYDALQQLTDQTGHAVYDTQVRAAADSLAKQLNSYAARLEEHYNNTVNGFQQDVETVNSLLTSIRDLNATIRKSEIHGDPALELRDERNLLIDQLSELIKIDVRYVTEDIGAGQTVEKLIISLDNANPDPTVETDSATLVDGIYAAQLQIDEKMPMINPAYNPNLEDDADPNKTSPYLSSKAANGTDLGLDADGNQIYRPVTDPADADPVDNTNFNLTLTALKDSKDRVLYTTTKTADNEVLANVVVPAEPTVPGVNATPDELAEYQTKLAEYEAAVAAKAAYDAAVAAFTGANANKNVVTTPADTDAATGITTITTYRKVDDGNGNISYYQTVYTRTPSTDTALDDNDLYGALQSQREMLTEAGEFSSAGVINGVDENAATKRGIPYYQKSLDSLASQLAAAFNTANTGYMYNENGEYINITKNADGTETVTPITYTDPDDNTVKTLTTATKIEDMNDAQKAALETQGTRPENAGNLFSTRGDTDDATGITAANISVSASWASSKTQVVSSYVRHSNLDAAGTTDSSNILHMVALFTTKMDYIPNDVSPDSSEESFFYGTFGEMWDNIGSVLGNDMKVTTSQLDTYYASSVELDTSRDSVSSVDLNDEAMNLMQYSKSYNAACRLMTTIDSILDKLINGTGVLT